MKALKIQEVIVQIENQCKDSGVRLTEKRKKILEILLYSQLPLSAYDVAGQYNEISTVDIHAMSVYRILEFLEREGFVHKIQYLNKFVACSHIDNDCIHKVTQFLVCKHCNKVKEVLVPKNMVNQLATQTSQTGFCIIGSQFEIQCICDTCSSE